MLSKLQPDCWVSTAFFSRKHSYQAEKQTKPWSNHYCVEDCSPVETGKKVGHIFPAASHLSRGFFCFCFLWPSKYSFVFLLSLNFRKTHSCLHRLVSNFSILSILLRLCMYLDLCYPPAMYINFCNCHNIM